MSTGDEELAAVWLIDMYFIKVISDLAKPESGFMLTENQRATPLPAIKF